jgi:hypothetical protein
MDNQGTLSCIFLLHFQAQTVRIKKETIYLILYNLLYIEQLFGSLLGPQ